METNECLHRNGGCWRDEATNVTACRDTYRGRVCECPVVNGVRYDGDGYTHCKGKPTYTFLFIHTTALGKYYRCAHVSPLFVRLSCWSGQVRAEPRRVLVGDQGGAHLLRLLGTASSLPYF